MESRHENFVNLICKAAGIEKETTGKRIADIVDAYIKPVLSERDELSARLTWLEDTIDSHNLEDILVEYQRRFRVNYWSGGA
tara:strand:- start:538 stop:783 length:246 start_codon:yes stop_codon:yes gene_type:complete